MLKTLAVAGCLIAIQPATDVVASEFKKVTLKKHGLKLEMPHEPERRVFPVKQFGVLSHTIHIYKGVSSDGSFFGLGTWPGPLAIGLEQLASDSVRGYLLQGATLQNLRNRTSSPKVSKENNTLVTSGTRLEQSID